MKYRVPAVLRHSVRYFLQAEAEPEPADRIKTPKVATEEPAAVLPDLRAIMERKILREEPDRTEVEAEPDTQPEVKEVETEEHTVVAEAGTPLVEPATAVWELAENPAHRPETAPTQPAWALNLKELERVEVLTVVAAATAATVELETRTLEEAAVVTAETEATQVPTLAHRTQPLAEAEAEATEVKAVMPARLMAALAILAEAEAEADMDRVETEETAVAQSALTETQRLVE